MPKLIFKFAGGPLDGKIVDGNPKEEGEARDYYILTYHGRLWQRFRVASGYALNVLMSERLQEERPHNFQEHIYEVVDRIRNRNVLLVLAQYAENRAEGGAKT